MPKSGWPCVDFVNVDWILGIRIGPEMIQPGSEKRTVSLVKQRTREYATRERERDPSSSSSFYALKKPHTLPFSICVPHNSPPFYFPFAFFFERISSFLNPNSSFNCRHEGNETDPLWHNVQECSPRVASFHPLRCNTVQSGVSSSCSPVDHGERHFLFWVWDVSILLCRIGMFPPLFPTLSLFPPVNITLHFSFPPSVIAVTHTLLLYVCGYGIG
jgi:hypothetical protein